MSAIYLPLECNKKGDKWKIINDKALGSGQKASVYKTCCDTECKYVLKLATSITYDTEREYNIHRYVYSGAKNLVPKIYHLVEYDGKKGIIMDKRDYTLDTVLEIINNSDKTPIEKLKAKHKIQTNIRDMVQYLHRIGIIHTDLHFGNIMCNRNENFKQDKDELYDMFKDWSIIDFGEAKYLKEYVKDTLNIENTVKGIIAKCDDDLYHINTMLDTTIDNL